MQNDPLTIIQKTFGSFRITFTAWLSLNAIFSKFLILVVVRFRLDRLAYGSALIVTLHIFLDTLEKQDIFIICVFHNEPVRHSRCIFLD